MLMLHLGVHESVHVQNPFDFLAFDCTDRCIDSTICAAHRSGIAPVNICARVAAFDAMWAIGAKTITEERWKYDVNVNFKLK